MKNIEHKLIAKFKKFSTAALYFPFNKVLMHFPICKTKTELTCLNVE